MRWEEKINSNLKEFKNFNLDHLGFGLWFRNNQRTSGNLTKIAFFWPIQYMY
ncbi:hypothetical protein BAXH7_00780 [Bacillus amyloliquefaciens XH7]|nr:hypothetical protein BAMTA208_03730 [Bacillus amyloliquefaciens TA208]AEB62378.1 hypothetical protein LL3_00833 [Bacillus amyloliquefaciens LL3]AEK87925.1 hypothetical protein BAXH7_00780 [Bacillus amyloliquefaciens XH7]ARW38003.1 hypothetical protein S101267_00894 [Bacillus amyloliquefaciens]